MDTTEVAIGAKDLPFWDVMAGLLGFVHELSMLETLEVPRMNPVSKIENG